MSNQESPAEDTLAETAKNPKFIGLDFGFQKSLFENGMYADIQIKVLEKIWKLHRCYLAKSPYFEALFEGSWKDSKQKVFEIVLPHEGITMESLDAIFESMYTYRIDFFSSNVVSILATASFFQLQDQMEECYDFMIETMNQDSVMEFYQIASRYEGGEKVKYAAIDYMKFSLTRDSFVGNLSKIDVELMAILVKDPDLCVKFNEVSLYSTLSMWLYTKVTGNQISDYNEEYNKVWEFFKARVGPPFLSTPEGEAFIEAFEAVRWTHLNHHYASNHRKSMLSNLHTEKIIPKSWIPSPDSHRLDYENFNMGQVSKDMFLSNSRRWGGQFGYLTQNMELHEFSVSDFNFGLQLIAVLEDYGWWSVKIKRIFLDISNPLRHGPRNLMIQLKLIVVNENGRILRRKKTDILPISLEMDEEYKLMNVEKVLQGENDYFFGVNYMYEMPKGNQRGSKLNKLINFKFIILKQSA